MIIIGIDPGQTGAVAIMQQAIIGTDTAYSLHDTPTIQAKRTEYNIPAMAALMPCVSTEGKVHAFIEAVHSMPKQGVASSFQLGKGYGIWLGILGALAIPYTLVTPQAWKKEMMAGRAKEKDASRAVAIELFPSLAGDLSLKKHHGRADALLIAEYGRRMMK